MKQTLKSLVLVGLMLSFSSSAAFADAKVLPGPQVGKQGGPEVKATDAEILHESTDEEGLHRLGDLGKLKFFGYGEIHYNAPQGPSENEIDFHRLVLGFGYDPVDWIKFRAELDFEHAFTEPELEYATIDFEIKPYFNVKTGAILLPMGVINQHHEPPLFFSVERPELYRVIIPTSWQEGGAGFFGSFAKGFDYEIYGISMPSAVTLDGGAIDRSFNGSSGIRNGRNGVAEAPAADFGVVGRLQYKGIPSLRLGTSFLAGSTNQTQGGIGEAVLTMIEADARYSFLGIDLEGTVAYNNISGADQINTFLVATDPTFTNFVGSAMLGWYVQAGYHLFHHLLPDTTHDLVAFARYERYDTQFRMPTGFAKDLTNDRTDVAVGLSYMPIPQVAIKADYIFNWNAANSGTDRFNLGVGFYY